jgi:hypothetical protein
VFISLSSLLAPAPHSTCGCISAHHLSAVDPLSNCADHRQAHLEPWQRVPWRMLDPRLGSPRECQVCHKACHLDSQVVSPLECPLKLGESHYTHTQRQAHHDDLCPHAPFVPIRSILDHVLCRTSSAPSLVLYSVRIVLTLPVACPQDSALLDSPARLRECPSRRDRCLQGEWSRRGPGVVRCQS